MLQSVSALSTAEAEYMALTEASKEAVWLKRLAKEFGIAQDLVRHHYKEGSYKRERFILSNKASHSSKVQALFELAQSCSLLKIEVEFLRVIRTILKTLQMSWKAMISTRSLRFAKVEVVGKIGSPKDTRTGEGDRSLGIGDLHFGARRRISTLCKSDRSLQSGRNVQKKMQPSPMSKWVCIKGEVEARQQQVGDS
ncbi:unnamed protein product [Prunus armeniaca]